jgi:tetratricopeptide (TPR) repeat protein
MKRAGNRFVPVLEDLMKTRFVLLFCLSLGFTSAYATPGPSGFFAGGEGVPPKQAGAKVYSRNPEANALYIQGLEYLSKGDPRVGGSLENARKALELFRQATQKDPKFAAAYIGQADALDMFSIHEADSVPPAKVYPQQEAAALKAVAIDDSLVEAHVHLADVYYDNAYDWAKSEKELKRVIELSPNKTPAICRYARFLATMGKFEEAEAQVKLAQAMDEKSALTNRTMSLILYWQHKDDAAYEQAMESLKKQDNRVTHYFLAYVYIHQGKFDKGIEEFKQGSFGDAESLAGLAYGYAMAGYKKELNDTLEEIKRYPENNQPYYALGQIYIALGDKDRAIKSIAKDYEQRSSRMNWLKVDPTLDPLRQDPRFKQLMHKMNFQQ